MTKKTEVLKPQTYLCALSTTIAVVLALSWTRGERGAGFDGFYYLEICKRLSDTWPHQFGTAWPYGYPLVGAFGTEVGLPAWWSLILINLLSLVITSFLSASLLPSCVRTHWSTTAVYCSLGAAPVVPLLLKSPTSECLFMALITTSAFLFCFWPKNWAIWGSMFTAFSSFCVRYAGIFMFGVIILYAFWRYSSMQKKRNLRSLLISFTVFTCMTAFLITLNVMQTGHIGGIERASGGGVRSIPFHASNLGWSFIGSVSSREVPKLIGGTESLLGLTVGWVIILFILGFCVQCIRRGSKAVSSISLVVLGYLASMVLLRSISSFNDLSQPRFALPVLHLLAVLLVSQVRGRMQAAVGILAIGVVAIGVIAAGRGQSKEAGSGNITIARKYLNGKISPSDTVLVNGRGTSLSAYYGARFKLVNRPEYSELISSVRSSDYSVFIKKQKGRYGEEGYSQLPSVYRNICQKTEGIDGVKRIYMGKTGCVLSSGKKKN